MRTETALSTMEAEFIALSQGVRIDQPLNKCYTKKSGGQQKSRNLMQGVRGHLGHINNCLIPNNKTHNKIYEHQEWLFRCQYLDFEPGNSQ